MKKSYVAVGLLLVVSMLALAPTIAAEVPSPVATEVRPVVVTNTASGPVPVQVMNPASAKVEPFQVQLQTAVTGGGGSSANFTTPRNLAVDYVSVSPSGGERLSRN